MNNLKEKLLSLGIFIDNKYLDFYCKLIDENIDTKKISGLTERHHIIQKAYYKLNNLPIDNTKDNLVNLTHHNHCLAHYYLCLCTLDELAYKNEYAFIKMLKIKTRFDFNLDEFLQQATEYNKVYENFIIDQSNRAKNRKCAIKGMHCFANGDKKIYAEVCPDGFWPSGANKDHKFTEEVKEKMSLAAKQRNSSQEYRLKLSIAATGKSGTVNNKIWITDGITEKYIDRGKEIPANWYKGRSKKSVENCRNAHKKGK